jgi:hypothetical protein
MGRNKIVIQRISNERNRQVRKGNSAACPDPLLLDFTSAFAQKKANIKNNRPHLLKEKMD